MPAPRPKHSPWHLSRRRWAGLRRRAIVGALFLVAAICPAPAGAVDGAGASPSPRDILAGPVEARVIRVRDGDTLLVRARIWVGQEVVVNVRIAGIDAPELRARCADERALAEKARDFVSAQVGRAPIRLYAIRNGKYAGRVLAGVRTGSGADLGRALIARGLARPYGGGRRESWCRRR
ncbi:MAG: thermonuclease family protein [Alphaproteobacteria bacterium]|nr:thermonuclease family protein [Alphaproteobacteria bacterium]